MKITKLFIAAMLVCATSLVSSQEITAFGTSFTYGEDVNRNQAYPVRLEEKLHSKGIKVKVLNLSVSGDTTADLINRIERIPSDSRIVIFEYAAGNDQRAGIKPEVTEQNAANAIRKLQAKDKQVLLILRGLQEDRVRALVDRWMPFIKETGIAHLTVFQPASKNATSNKAYFHPSPIFHDEIAALLVEPVEAMLAKVK